MMLLQIYLATEEKLFKTYSYRQWYEVHHKHRSYLSVNELQCRDGYRVFILAEFDESLIIGDGSTLFNLLIQGP